MKNACCLVAAVLACIVLADAMPAQYEFEEMPMVVFRARRSPGRVYYRRIANRRQGVAVEEESLSPCQNCGYEQQQQPEEIVPVDEQVPSVELEAEEPSAKAPKEEESDEEDEQNDFFAIGKPTKGRHASVNTFFPIQFGGGAGRSAGGAGATAIANSFSTGRKGSAASHATAYGHPQPN